jgi:predicted metalloprotease with PDZ domain
MRYAILVLLLSHALNAGSQQPGISYSIKIDTSDLSGFSVTMAVKNISSPFHVAMVAHPEYDDRYWRFVENIQVNAGGKQGRVIREDSALWKISAPGKNVIITYRIHLPAPEALRPAWRPFISKTGTLTGGCHTFFYIPGHEKAASTVQLQMPAGWTVATEMKPSGQNVFSARSADELTDAPFLAGELWQWGFAVKDVPHTISYYHTAGSVDFDTALLRKEIAAIADQADRLFNGLPYAHYDFLLQDGAYGALEHINSITVGAPSSSLATDRTELVEEIAHEYFHSWNLEIIRPAEYGDVVYKDPPLSRSLWFSEGFTMYYADVLLRRAGIKTTDENRIKHLEGLLDQYWNSAGDHEKSPEDVSLASNAKPGMLGDYSGSPHVQGELIASLLDIMIRHCTGNRQSLDDAMRKMASLYLHKKFTGYNLETVLSQTCGCDLHGFFSAHIRGSDPLPFDSIFAFMGWKTVKNIKVAEDNNGNPAAELGVYAWPEGNELKLGLNSPISAWVKAGLHTGDILVSINGKGFQSQRDFFRRMRGVSYGDSLVVVTKKEGKQFTNTVIVGGYNNTVTRISETANATRREKILREKWMKAQ